MNPEELLKTLRESLDDDAIRKLLSDCLDALKGAEDEEKAERAEASRLLGVEL